MLIFEGVCYLIKFIVVREFNLMRMKEEESTFYDKNDAVELHVSALHTNMTCFKRNTRKYFYRFGV